MVRIKFNVESKVLSTKFRQLIVPSVSEDCWQSINMPPFWRAIWHHIYMKYMLTLRPSDSAPTYTHQWYFYTDPEGCVQRRTRVWCGDLVAVWVSITGREDKKMWVRGAIPWILLSNEKQQTVYIELCTGIIKTQFLMKKMRKTT